MKRVDQRAWITATNVSGNARLVWLVLVNLHMNGLGVAWPSIETLTYETGLGRSTVKTAVRELEHAGELIIERGRGRGNVSNYSLKGSAADPFPNVKGSNLDVKGSRTMQKKGRQLTTEGSIEGSKKARVADMARRHGAAVDPPSRSAGCSNPDCASGWIYNTDGDVEPCPTCRPELHRDFIGANERGNP